MRTDRQTDRKTERQTNTSEQHNWRNLISPINEGSHWPEGQRLGEICLQYSKRRSQFSILQIAVL